MSDDDFSRSLEESIGARTSDGADPVAPNGGVASLDEVLRALANSQRRTILYYVRDVRVASVDELARQVVARERGVPPEEAPDDLCEQAKTELVHAHLPRLADTMCVEYDPRSQTVTYTDPPLLIDKTLEVLAQLERTLGE